MFDYIKKIIVGNEDNFLDDNSASSDSKKIQIATAALFIEIAKADGEFSEEERRNIVMNMKTMFNLGNEFVEELLAISEKEVKNSISVYEFSTVINDNFSKEEKYELMKNLWKIVFTDERLDQYEDRLIKIIGATLNLDHKDIIDAKLEVKKLKLN